MPFSFLAALLVSIVLAAHGPERAAAADEPRPIRLGAVYNQSGAQADLDLPSLAGARLAVAEANRAGGVLARPVELVVADGTSDLAVVGETTRALLKEDPSIAAVMGLSDTDMVLAAAPVAAERRRLFLTSGATSPRLPAEVPEYLFLACFGDNVQAAAAAEWAYRHLSARTASVLYNASTTYTRLLHGYFQKRFTELGGKILSEVPYTPGEVGQAIGRLKPADIVFLSAQTPQAALTAVRLLRFEGFLMPVLGGDGFDDAAVWRTQPDVSDVYFTTHVYLGADNPDPAVRAFLAAYDEAYPGEAPTGFAALGHDAARLLIRAVDAAGSTDPAAVLAAFAAAPPFAGVTGTVSYPAGSRVPIKSVTVLGIDKGETRLLGTLMPDRVSPP